MSMVVNHVTQTINLLKDIFPQQVDAVWVGLNGKCYQVALLLRHIYPSAEIVYDDIIGHVYTRIDNRLYDITGIVYDEPPCIRGIQFYGRSHKPHRWHKSFPSNPIKNWLKFEIIVSD